MTPPALRDSSMRCTVLPKHAICASYRLPSGLTSSSVKVSAGGRLSMLSKYSHRSGPYTHPFLSSTRAVSDDETSQHSSQNVLTRS